MRTIGDDDAPSKGVLGCDLVDRDRELRDPVGVLVSGDLARLLRRNVLVLLSQRRLRGRRVDGTAGKRGAVQQPRRLRDTVDSALGDVLLPRGPRDVPTDNHLDGEHAELSHLHRAAAYESALGGRQGSGRGERNQVVPQGRELRGEQREPMARDLSENPSLIWNTIVEDYLHEYVLEFPKREKRCVRRMVVGAGREIGKSVSYEPWMCLAATKTQLCKHKPANV